MKTLITATAFALIAASQSFAAANADLIDLDTAATMAVQTDEVAAIDDSFQTAAYCEWITLYDYWGNWVTLYECY